MDKIITFYDTITESLGIPISALLIIIIGWFITGMFKKLIKKMLNKSGISNKLSNDKLDFSNFIAKLVYFLIMIFVFMIALEKLGMTSVLEPVKELLNSFVSVIPNLIGAGLVGYIGYMLATIVSELVSLSGNTIQKFVPKLRLPENIDIVDILKRIVFIFIFIPLLIAALNILNITAVSEPATAMLQTFFEAIPKVLVATIIMLIFVVGGRFLSELLKDLLDSLNLNQIIEKANLTSIIGTKNIERLIANIVYAFIVLFGLMTAIEKLEFNKLSEIINTIVTMGGNILFGLLILAIGNWIANIAAKSFLKSDDNPFVSNIIKIAIIAIFLAISLGRMGIADNIINLAFGITLGAIALTIVLSFGLGGRDAAAKQMDKILNRFNKK